MPKNSKSNFNKDEQMKLKDKLIEIIGITKEKNYFSLHEIDQNTEMQEKILALTDDCKKLFATSRWTYFHNIKENILSSRPYILLIRNILSACDIKFYNKHTTLTLETLKKPDIKYYIDI